MAAEFFSEALEQSQVKAAIVAKYFVAWAKVIIPWAKKGSGRLAYIDLFAGPGRYMDGTKSTPVMILERAVADPDLREMLVTLFNDKDEQNSRSLRDALDSVPGVEKLRYKPDIRNNDTGTDIAASFEKMTMMPTLFFVDPFGYKGLSLRLINSVLKDWGCDCVIFFNYNRINMGLSNPKVSEHMQALFGLERATLLQQELKLMSPSDRELRVVENVCEALKDLGGKYTLPFRFRHATRGTTSHHLIFVSKNVRGYTIMKEIMAKESSEQIQGVASFEYNTSAGRQGLLFNLSRPLDELGQMLLAEFAGQTLPMLQVFESHHVDRRFIKKNYKDVLLQLEEAGQITTNPFKRRKGTFGDDVKITFPPQK